MWGSSHTHVRIFLSINPISAEVLNGWWFDFRRQAVIILRSQRHSGLVRFGPAPGQNHLPYVTLSGWSRLLGDPPT